jgi:acetyl-CoA acetyltransferase
LCRARATEAFSRSARDLRHHHRLALHQSADEAAVRRRRDAGDRRERRGGIPGDARDQDASRWRSQQRAGKAIAAGYFAEEIVPVEMPAARPADRGRQGRASAPETTLEGLAKLKTPFRNPGTVTAGNASGVNDGAAAMIIASEAAVKRTAHAARARHGMASAGVPPRIMGIGPVPSTRKLMERSASRSATST